MTIVPYLLYEDVGKAREFLTEAFGFQLYGDEVRGSDGTVLHAAMKVGEDVIMMGRPGDDYRNPKRLGQSTFSLYVTVPDVEGLHARAESAGARILERPSNTDYGDRRFGAEDPEGHQWYFAQRLEQPGASEVPP